MSSAAYKRRWRFFGGRFKGFGLGFSTQADEYGYEFEIQVACFAFGGVYE